MHGIDPDDDRTYQASAAMHWQRCFIALTPDAKTSTRLALRSTPRGARAVRHDDLHMTLAFMGDLPAEQGERIARMLPDIAIPIPALRLQTIEWWPDEQRPRVLVATFAMCDALQQLVSRIRSQLEAAELPAGNTFRPHITLARAGRRTATDGIAAMKPETMSEAIFIALTFYASKRDSPAGQYLRVASIPLATCHG